MDEEKEVEAEATPMKKIPLPTKGIEVILEATKKEYFYLQEARNGLNSRVGILIALLTALISVVFVKETQGLMALFANNLVLALLTVVFWVALIISFICSLIYYIRVIYVKYYKLFHYENFSDLTEEELKELSDEEIMMVITDEYARCVEKAEKQFEKMIDDYRKGTKWLVATAVFAICSLVIGLI